MKKILFIISVIINIVACESESRLASIDVTPSVNAFVGNNIVLEVSHSPIDAMVPAYHFKTSDQFVASVDDQGKIVCNHVGTCTIMVATADTRFSTTCTLVVKPNNDLYDEPVVDFNSTRAIVKLKETNKTIVSETSTILVYQGNKNPVQQVIYQFDGNQKLTSSAVKLDASVSSKLTGYLTEHYDQNQATDKTNLPVWKSGEMEVVAKITNEACFVVYNPYSGTSTYAMATNMIETIRTVK